MFVKIEISCQAMKNSARRADKVQDFVCDSASPNIVSFLFRSSVWRKNFQRKENWKKWSDAKTRHYTIGQKNSFPSPRAVNIERRERERNPFKLFHACDTLTYRFTAEPASGHSWASLMLQTFKSPCAKALCWNQIFDWLSLTVSIMHGKATIDNGISIPMNN